MNERSKPGTRFRDGRSKPAPETATSGEARPLASGLRDLLRRLDGESYSRYRELRGRHALGEFELVVDRVPPDPFAGPARVRLVVKRDVARLPESLVESTVARVAVEDYLARCTVDALARQLGERLGERRGGGPGSGRVFLESFGSAVIERSACRITPHEIELRLFVDLPSGGRRAHGRRAEEVFFTHLVRLATSTLLFSRQRTAEARRAVELAEDHVAVQDALAERGLVAFVARGSLLARAGGADEGPRADGLEIAFEPPDALTVTLELPHAGAVSGMGIPAGVTVIVGGAFHGKSTLLDAIAAGVAPHRPGDGRERVVTLAGAVVVRAEDGRSVRRADISGFLTDLPSGVRASEFTTEKASGSTSQASSIVEALEVGAELLLLDEDSSATNFMIRDGRMQRLIPRGSEPIIPFVDRVRELYERFGVSTILVTGGSGDYLEVADRVIRMEAYLPRDVTDDARRIVADTRTMRLSEELCALTFPAAREPRLGGSSRERLRVGLRGPRGIKLGEETLDLGALEQLTEIGQVRTLSLLMRRAASRMEPGKGTAELVSELIAWIDEVGLDGLDPPAAYDLSRPRRFELAAALNRWRALEFHRPDGCS